MGLDIWFTSGNDFLSKSEKETQDDINLWNSKVKENDLIYHLGDFSTVEYSPENSHNLKQIFNKLNGKKFLTCSPNDSPIAKYDLNWVNTSGGIGGMAIEGHRLVLSYYPFDCWYNQSYGALNLFGSMFESQRKHNRLSVNQNNYFGLPIKLEQIVEQINDLNFVF